MCILEVYVLIFQVMHSTGWLWLAHVEGPILTPFCAIIDKSECMKLF